MVQRRENGTSDALFAALTYKWDPATVDAFARELSQKGFEDAEGIKEAFQSIDTKATGLLTHVSMMIAGLGICAPLLAQHRIEEVIIVSEIAVYLLIAIGCLRCLSPMRSLKLHGLGMTTREHVQRELILRHELYSVCNKVSIYFTLVVFISLPAMLWWKPH